MNKNISIMTAVLISLTVCIPCLFGQDNAEVQSFEKLQRELWLAPEKEKANLLLSITAKLDSICLRLLEQAKDFSEKKASINSFYKYDGRNSLLVSSEIRPGALLALYNISYAGEVSIPVINIFSAEEGKARKVATLSLEKAECPDGMSLMVPFQKLYISDDIALKGKKCIVLAGANRIASYLVLIEMNWNKGKLVLLESKYFSMWNAGITDKDRIRLEPDGIVVRYPKESRIITEGWGESMLLVEDHICVKNGVLKTESREVLNPWYETVLDAIRLQAAGDREGFNKLCKAEGAWQLLSGKTDMCVDRQEKIDDTKAIVILATIWSPKKPVFYVSKEEEKWVIVKVDEEEVPRV